MPPRVPAVPSTAPAERQLTDLEFEIFSALVTSLTGIALGSDKRALLQARLGKRLRAIGLTTFMEYYRILKEQGSDGAELVRFVNAVTTNRTEFFREAHHFEHLRDQVAPALEASAAEGAERIVRVWSAGCSSGEEAYSIAITLADALPSARGWDVRILASDIDTDVLERGKAGTYALEEVAAVPRAALHRYFLRGVGDNDGLVRVRPELRRLVAFRRINLLDDVWPIRTTFDVVFCRNVLIYFDRPTQTRVLERLLGFVKHGGLLVLGHAEGVHALVSGLRHAANTMYRKEGDPCPPPS